MRDVSSPSSVFRLPSFYNPPSYESKTRLARTCPGRRVVPHSDRAGDLHLSQRAAMDLSGVLMRLQKLRDWLAFALSVLAVFVLQPASPVRYLDFWLPFATFALIVGVWFVLAPGALRALKGENLITLVGLAIFVAALSALRYTPACCLTATRPPETAFVLLALGLVGLMAFGLAKLAAQGRYAVIGWGFITLLVALLVILKTDALATAASAFLRGLNAQNPAQAAPTDLSWLGFSYIAFRLMHVLRDLHNGKRANMNLREFVTYVVFAPSLLAGPIDRAERFAKDLRAPYALNISVLGEAGTRLVIGAFKKFVLADALSLMALNAFNAAQTQSPLWMWLLVYAYAFRIFFDFAGYTDMAIGAGRLLGIKLPENFNNPYLKPNLTQFWNSWHITLAQWFRAYWFNPLTRWLRGTRANSVPLMVFIGQISTMLLIGLWHGVTLNFVAWGAWHGVGLFIHNRWADFARGRESLAKYERAFRIGGVILTFHFVALGWVFFALPEFNLSLRVLARLFGVNV